MSIKLATIKDKYYRVLEKYKRIEEARNKFSDDYISKLLGVEGKDLGKIIESWSKKFKSKEEKIDYILKTDIIDLEKELKDIYAKTI